MIFIFGIPRSGTHLIASMVGLHPDWTVALDPFMPIFHEMRNAALGFPVDDRRPFDPGIHDEITNFDLDRPFGGNLNRLRQDIFARASLEASDLTCLLNIEGRTFKELFQSGIEIIKKARSKPHVAIKELWTTDFTAALSRAFPQARFVFVKRNLKAILASMEKVEDKTIWADDMVASYTAHWHKHNKLVDCFSKTWPDLTRTIHYETAIPFVNQKAS